MSDLGIAASVAKGAAILANTDIFAAAVKPAAPRLYYLRVELDAAGVLSMQDTVNNWTEALREGVPLAANTPYVVEIPLDPADTLNFRYSVNANVRKFTLYQVPRT